MTKDNNPVIIIVSIIVIIGLIYGGWKLKRWWNYKISYQAQVQSDLEPIRKELSELRDRVAKLEKREIKE